MPHTTAEIADRLRSLLALRHTPEGRETLVGHLAARYVRRGAWWLRRNAPNPGWWRNCINGGRSRIHLGSGNEGPLSLAFEYEARFADEFGYVQDFKVLNHFFGKWRPERMTFRLGFTSGIFGTHRPFEKRYPGLVFTSAVLDAAWAAFLADPPGEWRINYRQPDAVEHWLIRTGVIARDWQRSWERRVPPWQRFLALFAFACPFPMQ